MLSLCEGKLHILAVVEFLLWTRVPFCLVYSCLELEFPLGGCFIWWVCSIHPRLFWSGLFWSLLSQTLKWLHLLERSFSSFTLRWCPTLILRCVSQMEQKDGSCFWIQCVNLSFYWIWKQGHIICRLGLLIGFQIYWMFCAWIFLDLTFFFFCLRYSFLLPCFHWLRFSFPCLVLC